ncbi:hypothetical protein BJV74DRAFT_125323 [Russula compacta]|nr:hypothetical protein BJV74DRAFT_125323 [Russula compacta]
MDGEESGEEKGAPTKRADFRKKRVGQGSGKANANGPTATATTRTTTRTGKQIFSARRTICSRRESAAVQTSRTRSTVRQTLVRNEKNGNGRLQTLRTPRAPSRLSLLTRPSAAFHRSPRWLPRTRRCCWWNRSEVYTLETTDGVIMHSE